MDTDKTTTPDNDPTPKVCDLKAKIKSLEALRCRLLATPEGQSLHARLMELQAEKLEFGVELHRFSHTLDPDDPDLESKYLQFAGTTLDDLTARIEDFNAEVAAFTAALDEKIAATMDKMLMQRFNSLFSGDTTELVNAILGGSSTGFEDSEEDMPDGFTRIGPGIRVMVLGRNESSDWTIPGQLG